MLPWIAPGARKAGDRDKRNGTVQGRDNNRPTEGRKLDVAVFARVRRDPRDRRHIAGRVREATAHDPPSFSGGARSWWALDNLEIRRAAAVPAGLELPGIFGILRGTGKQLSLMFRLQEHFCFLARSLSFMVP